MKITKKQNSHGPSHQLWHQKSEKALEGGVHEKGEYHCECPHFEGVGGTVEIYMFVLRRVLPIPILTSSCNKKNVPLPWKPNMYNFMYVTLNCTFYWPWNTASLQEQLHPVLFMACFQSPQMLSKINMWNAGSPMGINIDSDDVAKMLQRCVP